MSGDLSHLFPATWRLSAMLVFPPGMPERLLPRPEVKCRVWSRIAGG
jgi:hypothetical protein